MRLRIYWRSLVRTFSQYLCGEFEKLYMLMQMIDALKMARGNGLFTRPISLRNSGFAFQIVDDVGAYVCQRVNDTIERAANAPFPTIEAIEEEWEVITADEV